MTIGRGPDSMDSYILRKNRQEIIIGGSTTLEGKVDEEEGPVIIGKKCKKERRKEEYLKWRYGTDYINKRRSSYPWGRGPE